MKTTCRKLGVNAGKGYSVSENQVLTTSKTPLKYLFTPLDFLEELN